MICSADSFPARSGVGTSLPPVFQAQRLVIASLHFERRTGRTDKYHSKPGSESTFCSAKKTAASRIQFVLGKAYSAFGVGPRFWRFGKYDHNSDSELACRFDDAPFAALCCSANRGIRMGRAKGNLIENLTTLPWSAGAVFGVVGVLAVSMWVPAKRTPTCADPGFSRGVP